MCLITEHWLSDSNISFLSTFDNEFNVTYNLSLNKEKFTKTRGSGGTEF